MSHHSTIGEPPSTRRKRDRNSYSIALAVIFLPLIFGLVHNSNAKTTSLQAVAVSVPSVTTPPTPPTPAELNYVSFTVWVTAYSSSPDETDGNPFITASGEHVRDGIIASNFLPFGTRVTIPALFGNKVFVVEDRMNRDKSKFIDIWMASKALALQFGIHKVAIHVLSD